MATLTVPARTTDPVVWQSSLLDALGGDAFGGDATDALPGERRRPLEAAARRDLGDGAWLDVLRGWWPWPDDLFARLVEVADYRIHAIQMYDRTVAQPRLTAGWDVTDLPPSLLDLADAADELGRHHGVAMTRVTSNLYRDGRDSVAWHGDRVLRDHEHSVVAILTLGASRPFRLRSRRSGETLTLRPASGDLLVMGGSCQRTWQHTVPKSAGAGPRISVMFRHELGHDGLPVPYPAGGAAVRTARHG